MNKGTVAVAMSVYCADNPKFVKEAIESILNQSYTSFTLYIAVDGQVGKHLSSCLRDYESNHKIELLYFPENNGLAQRLNDIIKIASENRFKYLARMDADDVSYTKRLETQVEYLEKNPQVDVLGSGLNEINEDGSFLFKKLAVQEHKILVKNIIKKCPFNHPTVVFKMSIFSKEGFRYKSELKNTQDYYLWVDLLAAGKVFSNIEKPLLDFRIDDNFYKRRGLNKAINDFKSRLYAMKHLNNRSLTNLVHVLVLFSLRVSPPVIKKFAYKYLR
ncbi:glycosyltransferase [Pseudoalteromonas sp. NZS37]|uniref:glycosyltransferase n=1 Tax=Pseudoalteromonas sp. NZS37 TaxID=2792071 RepID=UPI0018CC9EA4|nr:glycosyltransferase [Pseudoalteromonas sp. NZS37]MBG9989995.1 glycosyltransferase [Pseudoalteromonas sp. NZS37]